LFDPEDISKTKPYAYLIDGLTFSLCIIVLGVSWNVHHFRQESQVQMGYKAAQTVALWGYLASNAIWIIIYFVGRMMIETVESTIEVCIMVERGEVGLISKE
jgi:hypothetical protein